MAMKGGAVETEECPERPTAWQPPHVLCAKAWPGEAADGAGGAGDADAAGGTL
jgi:hypothetical protein